MPTDTFDITGGYDPLHDYPLAKKPENPVMRESISFWISDDEGRFGFPRFCIEAVAGEWESRGLEANIAFPDGRTLIGSGGFSAVPPVMKGDKATTLDAGPAVFTVIDPLRHWHMDYDGSPYESTVQRAVAGELSGPERSVRIHVDAIMAVPPWIHGETAIASGDTATAAAVGAVGGHRHEQLFRCKGTFSVGDDESYEFTGTGLRIRRYGVRVMGDFPGHCWQSALFPSGKAFGISAFPPRTDGTPQYGEGYIFDGQEKKSVKVKDVTWMTEFIPHDGNVDIVLETEDGREILIEGRTHISTYLPKGAPMFGEWTTNGARYDVPFPFHQGGARYTWNGETTYGMVERSLPSEKMKA